MEMKLKKINKQEQEKTTHKLIIERILNEIMYVYEGGGDVDDIIATNKISVKIKT